jgi:cytoskeletal protein CcmA (bactofilin family)
MEEKKTDGDKDAVNTGSTEGESLENSDDQTTGNVTDTTGASAGIVDTPLPKQNKLKKLWDRINIYLLLFFLVLLLSGGFATILYLRNKSVTSNTNNVNQQSLSSDALQKLAANGIQVGDPKQVLNIQSNSVFGGTVLVKGELQVAGGLKIGSGNLAISDVNINGSATINQLQAQAVAVAGNIAIQGSMSVQKNLSVSGDGTFSGGITASKIVTDKLELSGDLVVTRHVIAGGGIPSRTNGNALGGGGTTSVSGSDTAGTMSINTGDSPAAGCFATVKFVNAYTSSPRVIITPVGSGAAGLQYYVNRNATTFSICTASAPPANTQFGYDYVVIN